MRKQFMFLSLLLVLALTLSACAQTPESKYKSAEKRMTQGSYTEAAEIFEELAGYSDSAQMAIYCKAVAAADQGNYALAVDALEQLGNYKDSAQLAQYYLAAGYERMAVIYGDITAASDSQLDTALAYYWEALPIYDGLSLYKDSGARYEACLSGIETIVAEQTQRTEEIYQQAISLENAGEYQEAIQIYSDLGSYRDSAARIKACRQEINYLAAIALEQEDALKAWKKFQDFGDYKESKQHIYQIASQYEQAQDYAQAVEIYSSILEYSDSQERIYQIAFRYEQAHDFNEAVNVYSSISEYSDSQERIQFIQDTRKFNSVGAFHDGLAVVCRNKANKVFDYTYGYIDTTGTLVIPCEWERAEDFHEGFAAVQKTNKHGDAKWGFIDTSGKLIAECQWDEVYPFSEGLACVITKQGKYSVKTVGFIDTTGKVKFQLSGVSLPDSSDPIFHEGLVAMGKNWSDIGFFDQSGNETIPFSLGFKDPDTYKVNFLNFNDGVAIVRKKEYTDYACIDKQGNILGSFSSDLYPSSFSEGLACTIQKVNGYYCRGFINVKGEVVIPYKFSKADDFHEGLAYVEYEEGSDKGFINTVGEMVIPAEKTWMDAKRFSEGLAAVRGHDGWGYIDTQGKLIIPIEYWEADDFQDGVAHVRGSGGYGYIRKDGTSIIPCKYDETSSYSEGYFILMDGGWDGGYLTICDENGNIVF